MQAGAEGPRLLRQPKLLFQLLHKLSQALIRDGVGGHGGHTLGLLKTPLQFFSVALFIHGDTPSFCKTMERRNGSHFLVRHFWNVFKRGYLPVALPKLNIVTDR
jgi:hypothetical protein